MLNNNHFQSSGGDIWGSGTYRGPGTLLYCTVYIGGVILGDRKTIHWSNCKKIHLLLKCQICKFVLFLHFLKSSITVDLSCTVNLLTVIGWLTVPTRTWTKNPWQYQKLVASG